MAVVVVLLANLKDRKPLLKLRKSAIKRVVCRRFLFLNTNYHEFTRIMLFNLKRWRIVKTDSRILPWKIEERYTLFFFLHWWNTPSFAPPHRFEKMGDAVNKIIEEVGDRANIEYRTDIIKTD